jgi:hypothetical protein
MVSTRRRKSGVATLQLKLISKGSAAAPKQSNEATAVEAVSDAPPQAVEELDDDAPLEVSTSQAKQAAELSQIVANEEQNVVQLSF